MKMYTFKSFPVIHKVFCSSPLQVTSDFTLDQVWLLTQKSFKYIFIPKDFHVGDLALERQGKCP